MFSTDLTSYLERYGKYLANTELSYFEQFSGREGESSKEISNEFADNQEVNWYLKELKSKLVETKNQADEKEKNTVRNRYEFDFVNNKLTFRKGVFNIYRNSQTTENTSVKTT